LWDNPDPTSPEREFSLAPDYLPRELPGGMALGQIRSPYVSGSRYDSSALSSESELRDFTRFTIVFSPSGSVVKYVPGGAVYFDNADIFTASTPPLSDTGAELWQNLGPESSGQTAVALFSYPEARSALPNTADYLTREAPQWILINMCTGQLFARQ